LGQLHHWPTWGVEIISFRSAAVRGQASVPLIGWLVKVEFTVMADVDHDGVIRAHQLDQALEQFVHTSSPTGPVPSPEDVTDSRAAVLWITTGPLLREGNGLQILLQLASTTG
jgi:hypothetical protein